MITPEGACPDCRHPWSWHPTVPVSRHPVGCVGRVPAVRLIPDAGTRPCPCTETVPESAYRARPEPIITEAEMRALWGDR